MSCQVISDATSWLVWWFLVYCFAVLHWRHCYFRRIMSLQISHLECTGETYVYMCVYIYSGIYIFNFKFKSHAEKKKTWKKQCFVKGRENESLEEEIITFFTLGSKQVHEGKITYQTKDIGNHMRWWWCLQARLVLIKTVLNTLGFSKILLSYIILPNFCMTTSFQPLPLASATVWAGKS